MELGQAVIVAGIGSRKGVSAAEVIAAVDAALEEQGLERGQLAVLATTEFKREERGIFEAGEVLGLEVVVVPSLHEKTPESAREDGPPPLTPPRKGDGDHARALDISPPEEGVEKSPSRDRSAPPLTCLPASSPRERGDESLPRMLSLAIAGVESVSEAAALAAAGDGARLAGPRIAVGRVTCAIAFGGGE